jgi:ribosomal protein S27AE
MEYRTLKFPTPIYEQVEMAKSKLALEKSKLKSLPDEVLKPKKCPICGNKMEGAEIHARFGYYKCGHCDYKQPIINIDAISSGSGSLMALGSGIIIGLGIAALLYLLFSDAEKED